MQVLALRRCADSDESFTRLDQSTYDMDIPAGNCVKGINFPKAGGQNGTSVDLLSVSWNSGVFPERLIQLAMR